MFFKAKWDPRGRHCYVTGGSSGLGLALAVLLTRKGAHVSIVARNEERLQKALEALEVVRQTPGQVLKHYSFAVDSEAGAAAAIEAASEAHGGRSPDAFFFCAGKSTPGFFVEQDEASMRKGMDETFWAQAPSALAASKRMVSRHEKGKLVFVSSVLGYFSIVGYSPYSPGKFAIRGLAEALQSELILYDIDVHIAFPGTIFSPGLEQENRVKPKVTLKIEEADDGATPETVAEGVFKGVRNGDFHITYDFIGNVFRASTAGSTPRNSYLTDMFYSVVGYLALPIWRRGVDSTVREHRPEHRKYLSSLAFFKDVTSSSAK
ncbi:NAD(P)-binding protein [Daedalea quercina L-15889]|uniref:NAD(P)-binding protein n=1 Tax=Daedalea quercina L-15889 TaxID=1314783 RepID=A0A165U3C2_9APHY|nr:NAD(P)-binding protein [Daedalea quercina L-15889]